MSMEKLDFGVKM